MTPEAFAEAADVSRETLDALRRYAALLETWNRRINLVGHGSLPQLWHRHMLDSAQLFPLIADPSAPLVDLGSGAGFPGLVLAAMGATNAHLIEADKRKCAFLAEAARVIGVRVTIHARRADKVPPFTANTVVSRATAPLPELLDMAEKFCNEYSILLFLKGRRVEEELTRARKAWNMRVDQIPSRTDPQGVILRLEAISRALRAHPKT
ncbi:MAG: 16S rRNA (guanine(527)-N(7))-methyltransferase RsmG [Rhodospirillales bacterium]|nr:MAG: 16S rRNA (guanine(527)-N(7))-methyltransferase RsmG [Rhodospirillales bacterium]